jgi:hypothetical protein
MTAKEKTDAYFRILWAMQDAGEDLRDLTARLSLPEMARLMTDWLQTENEILSELQGGEQTDDQ